jgi:hypothetical protein
MKTTHEKLLISLLALGLTSSAGLYGQSTTPYNDSAVDPFGFPTNVWDGTAGLQSWTYVAQPNGAAFTASEDVNGDGLINNGGTGPLANGVATFLPGEGPLLSEFADQVDYDGDGVIDATAIIAAANPFNEDLDTSGFITGFEDRDGDGNLDIDEDIDNDGNLDITTDFNGDGVINNGGTGAPAGGVPTLLPGEGALLNEDTNLNGNLDPGEDLNGNGALDVALSEVVSGNNNGGFVNEDVDGDGTLDLFNEDVNRNGVLDTDLPDRNFVASLDANGDYQDIDFLVENGLFVNGEQVATRTYVDNADAILQAQITTNTANIATNTANIARNRRDIDTNTRGIAMVAALQTTTVLPGMTQALDVSAAHFEGETGLAINYSRRINDNVQINFGAASTSDFDESVIKAGIGWQW